MLLSDILNASAIYHLALFYLRRYSRCPEISPEKMLPSPLSYEKGNISKMPSIQKFFCKYDIRILMGDLVEILRCLSFLNSNGLSAIFQCDPMTPALHQIANK